MGPERLCEAGQERCKGQRDEDEPADRLHHEIRDANALLILTGQTENGEKQKPRDGSEPSDRRCHVRGEHELAQARRQDHPPSRWRPGPWSPVTSKTTKSTTTT